MSRRATRLARGRFGPVEFGGLAYAAVMVVLAGIAAWPIYADLRYLIVVLASVAAAGVIVVVGHRLVWPVAISAIWTYGALIVIGLTAAVPLWRDGILRGLGLFFTGLVTSWKDLVTVDVPVGDYRNLLLPVVVVFLVGTVVGLTLAWNRTRAHLGAVAVFLAMIGFGVAFGTDHVGGTWQWQGVAMAPVREAVLGLLSLGASMAWLVWRARIVRTEALRHAAKVSGVQLVRPRAVTVLRVATLGIALVVGAVTLALVAAPIVLAGTQRQVLRSGVEPVRNLAKQVTPLESYRSAFSEASYSRVLFTVSSSGVMPERVRLATLNEYDGETFGTTGTSYRRLPSRRDPGSGQRATITITATTSGSAWLPSAGSIESVRFTGGRASELTDGFYYDPESGATVDTISGGLRDGDGYIAEVAIADPVAVSALTSPGHSPRYHVPESMLRWLKLQNQDSSGAGLAELAKRLTDRGYLSHALTVGKPLPAWVSDLGGGYQFRSSTAGHSEARLNDLFEALLARQAAANAETESPALVGGVGDDEQFAVAVALIADQLGFPSRVVVGARLSGSQDGIPLCAEGQCRGKNLTAWAEVQGADGRWAVVDATPQHEVNPDQKLENRRDPQNRTQVRPPRASEVDPPDASGPPGTADDPPAGLSLGWLWALLRMGAIGVLAVLVVAGPFLVVVAAKSIRRRHRRRQSNPVMRIVGGWEELVDSYTDHGLIVAERATRTEMATEFGAPEMMELAIAADRAVFSGVPISGTEADNFWIQVETERQRTAQRGNLRQRIKAALSLSSFFRGARTGEGGRRLLVSELHG